MRAMVPPPPGRTAGAGDPPRPRPGPGQVLLKVSLRRVPHRPASGGWRAAWTRCSPIIPGHEIVGRVAGLGDGVSGFAPGQRIGVPWLGWTCGTCHFCASGRENLCDHARFTGYQIDGGCAEFTVADARYCFPLMARRALGAGTRPAAVRRADRLSGAASGGDTPAVGIYGFGAAAHIVAQVLRHQQRPFYAFTRPGDGKVRISPVSWAPRGWATPCRPSASIRR